MRIKLDENLPVEIKAVLSARGLDCDTVEDEGLVGAEDPDAWKACLSEDRLLVTQDLDFSGLLRFGGRREPVLRRSLRTQATHPPPSR